MLIILAAFAAAAEAPPAQPATDADPIVCKRPRTSEVGTHMRPKPVCMKKSDWEYVEKNTQDELNRLGDRSAFNPGQDPGQQGPRPH